MRCEEKIWTTAQGWQRAAASAVGADADLVLYFAAPGSLDDGARWDELRAAHPRARLVGCTTAGEILGADVHDDSVVAAAVAFEHADVEVTHVDIEGAGGAARAGRTLGSQLRAPNLRGVFVLSDGTQVDGSALVAGLREALGDAVVLSGGLAGDGAAFRHTLVGGDDPPVAGRIVAVGFYGPRLRIGTGSGSGWEPFGPVRHVTRSAGNVLHELDGGPALAIYKRYLGAEAEALPASALRFPFRIQRHTGERPVTRAVFGVDEAAQSLTFGGDIPEGARVWFMRGTLDDLVQGAEEAAALARSGGESQLSVLVSCVGRRILMGQRVGDEVEAALEALGPRGAAIGFYSHGEISPTVGGFSDLHNQTMTVTTFAER
jgi:hypothetical protein